MTIRFAHAALVALLMAAAHASAAPELISHGRFNDVAIYRPAGDVRQVVLFLSGDGGWNKGVVDMAEALAFRGALVAGINLPLLLGNLENDHADCVFPDGDLENLSHFIQAYYALPTYHVPVLVGYSSGATFAYAMLAQAPSGTFAGGLSLGFCPDLRLRKPLCRSDGLKSAPRSDGKGVDLLPAGRLGAPWIALQGEIDQVCDARTTAQFVAGVPRARVVSLPGVGHGYSVTKNWMPQFAAAFGDIVAEQQQSAPPAPPSDLADLPLVEVPVDAGARGDQFAVLLTGDGGWAGLDKDVSAGLAAAGVRVVALDSLRYFWTARTPEGLARDLERIISHYATAWGRGRVLLVGYSQGANVLPFAVNRLRAQTRARIAVTALLGIEQIAQFEFHLANWIRRPNSGLEVRPELARLDPRRTLCLYGSDETNSPCATLDPRTTRVTALPGGHHFGGRYDLAVAAILKASTIRDARVDDDRHPSGQ